MRIILGFFFPEGLPVKSEPREPLRVNVLFQHIQNMLSRELLSLLRQGTLGLTAKSWNCPKDVGKQ